MNQLEENIVNSFRLAKSDIIKVQSAITQLSRKQEELMEMIDQLRVSEAKLDSKLKAISGKVTANKKAVAANQKKIQANKAAVAKKPKVITRTKTVVKKVVKKVPKGHYVASVEGSTYHSPKSVWAKQIKSANKVWFKSKAQAEKAGYKPAAELK